MNAGSERLQAQQDGRVYYDGRWMDVADRRPNFEVVYVVRRHIRQIRERRFSSNDV